MMLDNAINFTRELVRIPSESSDPVNGTNNGAPEAGIVQMLKKICDKNSFSWRLQEVFPGRNNFIVSFPKPGAHKVLFIAHMDTVSAKGMNNPFDGELKDNKIWGRGSCDDKGSLASIFATLIEIKEKGKTLKYDLTVVGSVDEECTMAGAASFIKEYPDSFDLCVAMEPSLVKPISTHKGVYRCRILPLLHEEEFSSACKRKEKAVEIVNEIGGDLKKLQNNLDTVVDPRLGSATMTITKFGDCQIKKNSSGPVRLLVDVRLLPVQSPAKIHSDILKIVGKRGKVIPLFTALGIDSDPTTPMIKKFQESIARQGECDDLIAVPFPSDCSQMPGQKACLVWGPGNSKQAHQAQEFIEVEQLEKACLILMNFLTAQEGGGE